MEQKEFNFRALGAYLVWAFLLAYSASLTTVVTVDAPPNDGARLQAGIVFVAVLLTALWMLGTVFTWLTKRTLAPAKPMFICASVLVGLLVTGEMAELQRISPSAPQKIADLTPAPSYAAPQVSADAKFAADAELFIAQQNDAFLLTPEGRAEFQRDIKDLDTETGGKLSSQELLLQAYTRLLTRGYEAEYARLVAIHPEINTEPLSTQIMAERDLRVQSGEPWAAALRNAVDAVLRRQVELPPGFEWVEEAPAAE